MTSQERARRWLADWFGTHAPAGAERSLAFEFDTACAAALLEGLKAAAEMEAKPEIPPHEPWPNKHNTPCGGNWWKNETDIEGWP